MERTSPHFWRPSRLLCPLGIAAVIAIWADTGTPVASTGRPWATAETAISSDADERTIAHVLNRIGFGPRGQVTSNGSGGWASKPTSRHPASWDSSKASGAPPPFPLPSSFSA